MEISIIFDQSTTTARHNREIIRGFAGQIVLFQDAVAKHLGMTPTDMKCFNILISHGSMTPGELARRASLTTGGTTRVLDHLESRGFVRRRAETLDRRKVIVEPLTPPHNRQFEDRSIDYDAVVAALDARYDPAQLAIILDFLTHGTIVLHTMTEQLQAKQHLQKGGVPSQKL